MTTKYIHANSTRVEFFLTGKKLPSVKNKLRRENWISCLDDADFVAVVTEVLETYDSEMVWELEDVERAKRTAWRIFQKCERLA